MRLLSLLPITPENEGAVMKRNEFPKTDDPMITKVTWLMALLSLISIVFMIGLINNRIDQKGTCWRGCGLNVDDQVTHAGSPDYAQTVRWLSHTPSDTEDRRSNGDGRPVIFSLPTSFDRSGNPPVGFTWLPTTSSQATYVRHINRFTIIQSIAHRDSKISSLPDNPHVFETVWLLACGVIGLAGLSRRKRV
ncbi:MAG: hypothetical protein KFF68_02675 [Desulfosarcina sp.]|nr:hypothetical protein [Desulfosarcina sp.]